MKENKATEQKGGLSRSAKRRGVRGGAERAEDVRGRSAAAAKEKKPHKKMTRKKRIIFSVLCVLVVIVATVAILFSVGAKGGEYTAPENTLNICLTPPTDGSLPGD